MNKSKRVYFKPSIFNSNNSDVERVYIDVLFTRDYIIGVFEYHGDTKVLGKPQKEAYMERVNKIKNN